MRRWARAVETLAADRRHGAGTLSLRAASILAAEVDRLPDDAGQAREDLLALARAIARSQPSMASVENLAAIFAGSLPDTTDLPLLAMEARSAARGLVTYWIEAPRELSHRHAAAVKGTVVTHSASSDVLRTLVAARPDRVVLTESRPGRESRHMVRALTAEGIAVTMVPDSAGGHSLRSADVLVLGADSVLPNGDIVNKVGSFPLALAAMHCGVPVLVLAETMKVTPDPEPDLGAASAAELPRVPEGVEAGSPIFETVPREAITAILTEDGALDLPTLAHIAGVFADQRRALDGLAMR